MDLKKENIFVRRAFVVNFTQVMSDKNTIFEFLKCRIVSLELSCFALYNSIIFTYVFHFVLFTAKASPLQTDYKFDRFMSRCLALQKEKKSLEMQIRLELDNWKTCAKNGAPTSECRYRLSMLLKGFKAAQQTQDILIEKEKQRISSNENEYSKPKVHMLKNKLKFFALLNKQHEKLLEMVRQDVLDCRSICRQNYGDYDDESSIRYKDYFMLK